MKAILIPANTSDPVREIDFDPDESWRYVVTRYGSGAPGRATSVAFLTKENAPRDYLMRNSRASEFVRNEFHAANDQTDGLGSPEDLYGDVVVLGYDKPAFETLTDVPAHVDPDDFEPFELGPGDSVRSPDLDPVSENFSIPVRSAYLDDFEPGDSVHPLSLVLAALAAGALKGVGETVTGAIEDAYVSLRQLVARKLRGRGSAEVILDEHARDPDTYAAPMVKELRESGAAEDPSVIEAAQKLMALLDPQGAAAGHYNVGSISADRGGIAAARIEGGATAGISPGPGDPELDL